MIFGWLRRRSATRALRDVCGFVDTERFERGVRSIPLSERDARVVDVCKGCGALWCDAGEHARLMGGMT